MRICEEYPREDSFKKLIGGNIMENTSVSKKENPNLYVPEWYREMVKELMESFEGTSTSSDFPAAAWDRIRRNAMLMG